MPHGQRPGLKGTCGLPGLVCYLALAIMPVLANADLRRIELASGQEVEVIHYAGDGGSTILWLPSERGFSDAHRVQARALAGLGHQVWLADFHNTWLVQPGRSSISQFPLDEIVQLLEAVVASSANRVLLVSSSRGAQSALIAAREWQLRHPGNPTLAGLILAHPHLYRARPLPGENAQYLPIVEATNLPVFLLAAEYSTKSSRIEELASELGTGGSSVYTQVLAGVQGGFFTRDESDNSDQDQVAKQEFAATVSRAGAVLNRVKPPARAVVTAQNTRQFDHHSASDAVLSALARPLAAPPLQLSDIDGRAFTLADHAGQVVLVNFWASWCRPCVTEIPSLHRLEAILGQDEFRIVTVNVGEDRERITRFLQQVPVELPVLMDYDASISKDWMIYVYPSSYLVDHQGIIRYAYLGALEWDSTENLRVIRNLLSKR